jgi:vacuolar-type H+-ATPase subunit E/Vma4
MDKTPLESSIREEARRAIQAVKEKEESEIRRLDEVYAGEIEEYKKKIDAEIDVRIEQELSKLENRSMLERKKLRLRIIEDFISTAVDEAVKDMRDDPRYKQFLLDTVSDAVKQIHAHVEVHLKGQDRPLGDEIMEKIKKYSKKHDLVIHEDNTIKWGGCIINDEAGGRIFNGTIERIYFRKSQIIHQEIMKIMKGKGLID